MGSRAADSYKMHIKALKRSVKKKLEAKSCYRLMHENVHLIDSMNPGVKIPAKILKTKNKNGLMVIEAVKCPHCGTEMKWDDTWQGFLCRRSSHPRRRGVYEVVNPTKVFG